MILILCPHDDGQVSYVTARLDALGAEYLWFDPADFPSGSELRVGFESTGLVSRVLRYKGRDLDLARVTAVWHRRTTASPAAGVRPESRWWVSEVSTSWLVEVWESIECLWIPYKARSDREPYRKTLEPEGSERFGGPPLVAGGSPFSKLNQLAVAARLGFHIPRTLMTNSPEGFLEFYEKCQGRLVTKTVCALRTWRDGEEYTAFTHMVRRRDAAKYRAIRYAPVIVQEYVPKRLELRITVVGSSVFAAAIHSQTSPLTRNDWRRECDPDRCYSYYARYVLPPHIEELCVRLVETLGLCFGAIDMVVTPDDEYIFLEINPNGQWAFIQQATGLPIGEAIADLLLRGAVSPTREEVHASTV